MSDLKNPASNDANHGSKDLSYDNVVPVLDGSASEDAIAFLAAHGGAQTYDDEARKKLVRKIDMHLLPLMCITYCLQVRHSNDNADGSMLTKAQWRIRLSLVSAKI